MTWSSATSARSSRCCTAARCSPGCENFLLYDFFTPDGWVNEDVFAYSNGLGERARAGGLPQPVWRHPRLDPHVGRLFGQRSRTASARSSSAPWAKGWACTAARGAYLHLPRPGHRAGVHPLQPGDRPSRACSSSLHAYEYHVFLDFREVATMTWGSYRRVNEYLAGRGVPSVQKRAAGAAAPAGARPAARDRQPRLPALPAGCTPMRARRVSAARPAG